jgi:hypothetical protein
MRDAFSSSRANLQEGLLQITNERVHRRRGFLLAAGVRILAVDGQYPPPDFDGWVGGSKPTFPDLRNEDPIPDSMQQGVCQDMAQVSACSEGCVST